MVLPRSLAALTLALLPVLASAQSSRWPWAPGESGFVMSADLGVGTALGAGGQYTPSRRLELEVSGGYEFPLGIRPEIGIALGAAPGSYFALRPGIHYTFPDTPLFVRGAVDWSSLQGPAKWRWILFGGGGEIRLTGVLAGFAEADLGVPVVRDVGLELMIRAGISLRL